MAANGTTRTTRSLDARASARAFTARLNDGPTLLLDGATGTELERRGVRSELPLWSARALVDACDVVEAIHRDYVAAGADALTANTFRTHARSLATAGLGDRAGELTGRAVELARAAAREEGAPHVFVFGSAAPLEDCYRPDLVPEDASLEREHALHARHLAEAGVDAILVETMNSVREARIALGAARRVGVPALVSFVCDGRGQLLSGEPLEDALRAVEPLAPLAALVNCLPPRSVEACLDVLVRARIPFGAFANLGAPTPDRGFVRSDDCAPEEFAEHASRWAARGARILGGCCGTQPLHIRATADRLRG